MVASNVVFMQVLMFSLGEDIAVPFSDDDGYEIY